MYWCLSHGYVHGVVIWVIRLCIGSSALGDGTLSQILHIPSLLHLQDFSYTCVWPVSYVRLFQCEVVGMKYFHPAVKFKVVDYIGVCLVKPYVNAKHIKNILVYIIIQLYSIFSEN